MSKKKIFMSVTASAVIASTFIGAKEVNAASHTVKQGDTLWSISQQYHMNVEQLKSLNNLSNTIIYPSQVLEVGNSKKKTSSIMKPVPQKQDSSKTESKADSKSKGESDSKSGSNTKSNASTYTIKSGDTLSQIAFKHGISLNDLMAWNNLESTLIFPGNKLIVSKSTTSSKPSVPDKNTVPKPSVEETQNEITPATGSLIEIAKSALGTPYQWGGTTTSGFDCSGFIHWALNKSGSSIGRHSTEGYYNRSYIVNAPQIGDFVFFENTYKAGISHMGIYVGNNKFIHASTSQGVTITDLSNPYWNERFHSYKKLY